MCRLLPRQQLDARRQILERGISGSVDKDGENRNLSLQSRGDLEANQFFWVVQTTNALLLLSC